MTRITTHKPEYTFDYPVALKFVEQQMDVFWLPDEIEVEKDIQDIKVNMTEAERHGVITTLKLFTLYELFVGNEYWGNKVMKSFPRADIQRMANCFSFFELNVHAPFYNKVNELLGLATDEFYNSYVDCPVLSKRIEWIEDQVGQKDLLKSLGVFAMMEGAILFSSFAFLKHFQAQGKNKLANIVAGINFSVRDENLHCQGGSWLFRTLLEESNVNPIDKNDLKNYFIEVAEKIRSHEAQITAMIFAEGDIPGITAEQVNAFVEHRLDTCLEYLGFDKHFKPQDRTVRDWFYKNVNTSYFNDFFSRMGNQYNRNWVKTKFAVDPQEDQVAMFLKSLGEDN